MFDWNAWRGKRLFLDGGTGTMLQRLGLAAGELPELWNLTHAAQVTAVHRQYFEAGSNIVCTNTFGANRLRFSASVLPQIIAAAVEHAQRAALEAAGTGARYVALDVGPLGRLLKPYGDLDFAQAVDLFSETIRLGAASGAELILIETMSDSYETKAAVLAAKEACSLPIFASNAYGEDGKLMTGASPEAMVALLEGLGVDALGVNCSFGPHATRTIAEALLDAASVPVFVKPNAGLPESVDGETRYSVTPAQFAEEMRELALAGVSILGGCCGTTPDHIRQTVSAVSAIPAVPPVKKERTVVSSYTHCVTLGQTPVLIGERINPTGKKRLKQALLDGDMEFLLSEGLSQQECGAHLLDVNVGLPGTDEPSLLARTVCALQAVIDLPLQLDTADPEAMARALRLYNGKALLNSVNGRDASMRTVFPLVKKYGGVVTALTLDENGIPATAAGRMEIALRILRTAAEYGLEKKDLIFDPLCMAVSAAQDAAQTTLETLQALRALQLHTVLGISNISFGLPQRELVNAGFFAAALENGLCAAIVNPRSAEIRKTYYTYRLLHGMDPNCKEYLAFAARLTDGSAPISNAAVPAEDTREATLSLAIEQGRPERAAMLCAALLRTEAPLAVIDTQILPALDAVGRGFEAKTVYLPQLLMSADAAKAAFAEVQRALTAQGGAVRKKAKFVLATVRGDIHDIGKNIVKVLLENYGFQVVDLGKDVLPQTVAEAVVREHAPMCGLSALMTTTVPAMEETIRLLRSSAPDCRIVVGGAVLTGEYAARIGADSYAKDAMQTVRWAEEVSSLPPQPRS